MTDPTTTVSCTTAQTGHEAFKIAVISTMFHLYSHTDVIATRWTTPRPSDKDFGWIGPSSQIVSMHIEQITDRDTGVAWAKAHKIPLMTDVEQAMTLGQDNIAVDAVLLIGEHGDYDFNEIGQKKYPRKALFDKIVSVFKKYNKVLPVFCDKHYSYDAHWAHEMVETARKMGFAFTGGSSIPHTPFVPKSDLKAGFKPAKALAVYYGDKEAYLYHSIEFAQSIIEKRQGGESGIKAVTAWEGPVVWGILKEKFGDELLTQAMQPSKADADRKSEDMKLNCAAWAVPENNKQKNQISPMLIVTHHADGLEVGHVNLNGHIQGWSMAIQTADNVIHAIGSTAVGLDVYFAHFATFSKLVETFLLTGKYPFPPERALLTTCATAAAMHAMQQLGRTYPSPLTMVAYQPMQDLTYHPGK